MRAGNYLNNKDLLKEIHKSKITYCSFTRPEYTSYDMIINDVDKINKKTVSEARKNRAERLAKEAQDLDLASGIKKKLDEYAIAPTKIPITDVVFRVMTWEHIPIDEAKQRKADAKAQEEYNDECFETEYDEPVVQIKAPAKYVKVNFPPFQHYVVNDEHIPMCVGKSHWQGNLETGHFSKDHGQMTPKLAHMFIKLCERYATRYNWRGYCVDSETEALTQRGWVTESEINEDDVILSYDQGNMKWSKIKSIYRGEFDGFMHKLDSKGMDALITPGHKLVTKRGLVKVEHLLESDKVILMGDAEKTSHTPQYSDSLVELVGWILTKGCYQLRKNSIQIYQNEGVHANRIRACLTELGFEFSESLSKNICFSLSVNDSKYIFNILPKKNLNMNFILALTLEQRELLIDTMVSDDGWVRGSSRSYCQKDREHINYFTALCAISGYKTNTHLFENHKSFGKLAHYYNVSFFRRKSTKGECIDFNGGKRNGRDRPGQGKESHPNVPTTHYKGTVWCPETEFGCFVARRNGKVYLTGNTYNDEMRSQALLQLSQIGLQFDESKSQNPFAYYTAAITNSFTRVLNIEKRNQNIRDDILELNNYNPSYTRQNEWGGGGDYDE